MIRFEGQNEFSLHPPEQLFERLSDARFLVLCVPDVREIRQQEKELAVYTLRPGFAFIRGTLEVKMRVAEAVSPTVVRLALESKGIGTSSEVEAILNLTASGAGSKVDWSAEVKRLGGLLKAVPSGLIRGAAQKVLQQVLDGVQARLKAEKESEPPKT